MNTQDRGGVEGLCSKVFNKNTLFDPREQGSIAQRAYIAILIAMVRGQMPLDTEGNSSQAHVVKYIIDHPRVDAFVVLVSDSFNDPLPRHCLLLHRDGRRLADIHRVCRINGKIYEWIDFADDRIHRGVLWTKIPVSYLFDNRKMLLNSYSRRVDDLLSCEGDLKDAGSEISLEAR
jgi:hypothetical protein